MLFAWKNVHLGYMSPPEPTLRALNHSYFQRKRRLRSPDGHKPMHFLWETHTLVTIGPKGLTSRALNQSSFYSNRIHCGHGVPQGGLHGPEHAKISIAITISIHCRRPHHIIIIILVSSLSLSLCCIRSCIYECIYPAMHPFIHFINVRSLCMTYVVAGGWGGIDNLIRTRPHLYATAKGKE